jgi:hypothetical protein
MAAINGYTFNMYDVANYTSCSSKNKPILISGYRFHHDFLHKPGSIHLPHRGLSSSLESSSLPNSLPARNSPQTHLLASTPKAVQNRLHRPPAVPISRPSSTASSSPPLISHLLHSPPPLHPHHPRSSKFPTKSAGTPSTSTPMPPSYPAYVCSPGRGISQLKVASESTFTPAALACPAPRRSSPQTGTC